MTLELIGALLLGFLSMIGIYTLLRQLEKWCLGRGTEGKAVVLLFPGADEEENQRACRRTLLQMEAHPLSACQQLFILEEQSGAMESFGLMGEKTSVCYLSMEEAAEKLKKEAVPCKT